MVKWMVVLMGLVMLPLSAQAVACGPDTDCVIGDRTYRIRMPEGHDGVTPVGAIVFVHGYRGTAAGVMRNKSLMKVASDLGVALIAVTSVGGDWSVPGAPKHGPQKEVDELAYFDRVIADVAARFPIDTDQIMVTGFSAGGMMVWNLACRRSEKFAAFAPMAGTFWRPIPRVCTGLPASIVHIHGDNDKTVPLNGRRIQQAWQGNVTRVIEMYAAYGGFGPPTAKKYKDLRCEQRQNGTGQILDFCLFSGGHSFRSAYVRWAWDRFVDAGQLRRRSVANRR